MVSGEVGRGSCQHVQVCGVTLLCFGRLKGSQCSSEGWLNSSDDLEYCPKRDFYLGAGAKGTAPCSHSLSPVSSFLGVIIILCPWWGVTHNPMALVVSVLSCGFSLVSCPTHSTLWGHLSMCSSYWSRL